MPNFDGLCKFLIALGFIAAFVVIGLWHLGVYLLHHLHWN